jgi:hypothetical protein
MPLRWARGLCGMLKELRKLRDLTYSVDTQLNQQFFQTSDYSNIEHSIFKWEYSANSAAKRVANCVANSMASWSKTSTHLIPRFSVSAENSSVSTQRTGIKRFNTITTIRGAAA